MKNLSCAVFKNYSTAIDEIFLGSEYNGDQCRIVKWGLFQTTFSSYSKEHDEMSWLGDDQPFLLGAKERGDLGSLQGLER